MPHKELTHIVLTRFNTAIGYAPSAKGLDEKWLTERLTLFEQYCLPSVAAQQDVEFTWLVFCDARSPAWFQQQMASYGSLLRPIYIEGPATDEVIAQSVRQINIIHTPYLVTTRLDNDDALGDRHLAAVQKAFRQQKREFLVFPFGLQSLRGHLYNVFWKANPFLSLIERVGEDQSFTTAFCVPHDKVHATEQVRMIYDAPQWLQVIHGSNLLNSLRGWPRLSSNYPSHFKANWPPSVEAESLMSRIDESGRSILQRGIKLADRLRSRLRRASS